MTRIRFLEHFGHDGGIRQSAGAKLAASREDKVAILSDARAVTPTDAATAKNEAADDGSVMSSQSVFSCQTLPTELYREVLKAHSCKGVIAPQFAITFPILGAVPYRGPLQAAGGAAHEVRLRRDEARGFDAHYRPECCSGGDDDRSQSPSRPTGRGRRLGAVARGRRTTTRRCRSLSRSLRTRRLAAMTTRVAKTTTATVTKVELVAMVGAA